MGTHKRYSRGEGLVGWQSLEPGRRAHIRYQPGQQCAECEPRFTGGYSGVLVTTWVLLKGLSRSGIENNLKSSRLGRTAQKGDDVLGRAGSSLASIEASAPCDRRATPAIGACTFRSRALKVPMSALTRTSDAQANLQEQFDRHKCKPEDANQPAAP